MKLKPRNFLEGDYEKYIQNLTKNHMKQLFIDNFGGWSNKVSKDKFFKVLKNGFVKLFFLENDFVGYVTYEVEKNNKQSFLINDIHIESKFQNKGYGTNILEFVKSEAIKSNKTQLKVFVFKNNLAIKFYAKKGFKEVENLEKSNSSVMVKEIIF